MLSHSIKKLLGDLNNLDETGCEQAVAMLNLSLDKVEYILDKYKSEPTSVITPEDVTVLQQLIGIKKFNLVLLEKCKTQFLSLKSSVENRLLELACLSCGFNISTTSVAPTSLKYGAEEKLQHNDQELTFSGSGIRVRKNRNAKLLANLRQFTSPSVSIASLLKQPVSHFGNPSVKGLKDLIPPQKSKD